MIPRNKSFLILRVVFILLKLGAVVIMATQVSGKFIYGGF